MDGLVVLLVLVGVSMLLGMALTKGFLLYLGYHKHKHRDIRHTTLPGLWMCRGWGEKLLRSDAPLTEGQRNIIQNSLAIWDDYTE